MNSTNPVEIAIYDLDGTITRAPTFTPFLIFAALHRAPWRVLALPVWLAAMIGYKLKFYGRNTLKAFGVRLFIGRHFSHCEAERLAARFIARLERNGGFRPGALAAITRDRTRGARLLVSTAAPQFYAEAIAQHLGFDACISTRHRRSTEGGHYCDLADCNNFGPEKLVRLRQWLADEGLAREACRIVFYSDHRSDAPLFDWADEAVFIGTAPTGSGWRSADWRSAG